jgi:hypothetical protein
LDDEKGNCRSEQSGLRERAQNLLHTARSVTLRRLRQTRERAGHALGSTAKKLKESEAGERLSAALETRRVLKKAQAAHARGNPSMAHRLLATELQAKPTDERLVVAFWRTCVVLQRGSEASEPLMRVIRRQAASGDLDEAARLWCELIDAVVDARIDAGTLIRIAIVLRDHAPDRAVHALRAAIEPETPGLTNGLATRVVEQARELDPPTALLAAQWVLQSADLAEAKRARLEGWVTELEHELTTHATSSTSADSGPGDDASLNQDCRVEQQVLAIPDADLVDRVVEQTVDTFVPSTRFSSVKATEAVTQSLTEDAVRLQMHDGRNARLDYAKVQAVGVAEISGLAANPVVLIDLALNWHSDDGEELRVVRLRGDRFSANEADERPNSLRSILAELFSRTAAEPLPNLEAARGDVLRTYDDVCSYEREVLLAG